MTNCAKAPEAPVTALPEWPPFAAPVKAPSVRVGDDLRFVAARNAAARRSANRIISEAKVWYTNVKIQFEKRND